jgi:hypothetical protein
MFKRIAAAAGAFPVQSSRDGSNVLEAARILVGELAATRITSRADFLCNMYWPVRSLLPREAPQGVVRLLPA